MMTKRFRLFASVTAACAALSLLPETAEAQEIQLTGPLAGAPSHRKLRQYRKKRFEIAPTVTFSLLDEYRRTILLGGKLQYNVTDWLGVGVWGAFGAINTTTALTDNIAAADKERGPRVQTAVNMKPNGAFSEQTARLVWTAAPQIQVVPFRGKLALFQKLFVDTDAYLHAGLAFVGLRERGDCAQGACSQPGSFDLKSRVALAPTFGLGLNFYPSKFVSFGFEYRAMPFAWNRAGFDTRGGGTDGKSPDQQINSDDRTFKFNQMVSIHVGFSFPTKPKISD